MSKEAHAVCTTQNSSLGFLTTCSLQWHRHFYLKGKKENKKKFPGPYCEAPVMWHDTSAIVFDLILLYFPIRVSLLFIIIQ